MAVASVERERLRLVRQLSASWNVADAPQRHFRACGRLFRLENRSWMLVRNGIYRMNRPLESRLAFVNPRQHTALPWVARPLGYLG
jgi:hypothetical protein